MVDRRKPTKVLLYYNTAGVTSHQAIALVAHIMGRDTNACKYKVGQLVAIAIVPKIVVKSTW